MIHFFKRILGQTPTRMQPQLLVVEVEKPRSTGVLSDERKQQVALLQHSPGFQYLIEKLRYQKFVLETLLKKRQHTELREVYLLQSGVNWIEWIEEFVQRETTATKRQPVQPTVDEDKIFNEALASIEAVGN